MKLYETLLNQLQKEKLFVTEQGELKKWVVIAKAQNYDPLLIKLLLENDLLKERFFVKIQDALVFKREEFISFLELKNYLNDSYTRYKNKIGLSINGKFLKQKNEVVLAWPYKDCVLEGGQSREEDKREEIFFNEILARDEITQLFEPKVLSGGKYFDRKGEHELKDFVRNAELNRQRGLPEDTLSDNLIIKGNNLLALHALKKEFAGKIKMIYIDPPYNTGSDGFKYNDRFTHSTWLTFMKNRLEASKSLLKENGGIFVQCDDNEQAYLKVLMDEVFGRENFVANMVRKAKAGGGHDSQFLAVEYDYILFYAKDINHLKVNQQVVDTKKEKKYNKTDEYLDRRGKYYLRDLDYKGSYSKSMDYPITLPSGKEIYPGGKFGPPNTWRWKKEKVEWGIKNGFIVFNEEKEKIYIKQYEFVDNEDNIRVRKIPYRAMITALNSEAAKEIMQIFQYKAFEYPKPESLLKYLMEILTDENDIVLDYYLGSGTTAAVAHKMNRQYIGIEQMDYIKSLVTKRMKQVIEGEEVGVSKQLGWKGGGSFAYFELKKYNQAFIEKIQKAETTGDLLQIWELMKERSFLNYNVDLKKQEEHLEDFKRLPIDEQKRHLIEILDKNQLYVNLSSMNDKDFQVNKREKLITQSFYQI